MHQILCTYILKIEAEAFKQQVYCNGICLSFRTIEKEIQIPIKHTQTNNLSLPRKFLIDYMIYYKKSMTKRQNPTRLATLANHIEKELQREAAIQEFYQKRLQEINQQQRQLEYLPIQRPESNHKSIYLTQQIKQESEQSFMGKSKISVTLPNPSKIDKNKAKVQKSSLHIPAEPVNFVNQYQNSVENLMKVMNSLTSKQQYAQNKKEVHKTKSTSFYNKSMRGSKLMDPKKQPLSGSSKRIKTDRSMPQLTKKQYLMADLGDVLSLRCEDQIINNLLKNLKIEEQRYINNILTQTDLSVKTKMKHYMARQCQRYEQRLFKIKQQQLSNSQRKVDTNKQMIRRGYTLQMKELVEKGLRLSSSSIKV